MGPYANKLFTCGVMWQQGIVLVAHPCIPAPLFFHSSHSNCFMD